MKIEDKKCEEIDTYFLPENLEKDQQRVMQKNDFASFNNRNDFESYKLLLHGKNNTGIETHNLTGMHTEVYTKIIKKLINKYDLSAKTIRKIADIGCGAGFLSAEIGKQFASSKISGYDISLDAIKYAKNKFTNINFIAQAFEINMIFPEKFDLIHTREFYPFTRNNSLSYQISCIDTLLNNLNDQKLILIGAAHTKKCILNNIKEIEKMLKDKADLFISLCPATKIYSLCSILPIAQMLTFIFYKISNKRNYYILILRKK